MAIVVLDHVPTGRGTGHDRPSPFGDEHTRSHSGAPRMLKDNVGGVTHERANVLSKSTPLRLILGVLVFPELVILLLAIDDVFATQFMKGLDLVGARHHTYWRATGIEHVLDGERSQTARGTPDQNLCRPA